MLKLKNELKELAVEIRQAKNQRNEAFRNGMETMAGTFQYDVLSLKHDYRHKHIAYSLMRGKEYSQVEPKVRKGNEPDMKLVESYIQKEEVA